MQRPGFHQLHGLYDDLLRNNIIPWWFRHAIDREHGGLFTCIHDDGSKISTDKYLTSQCRAVWTFAALYNRFEPRPEFLEIARATARFILEHGRDEQGRFVHKVTREGKPLEGATSIYNDFFATYGLGELYRATKEQRYLDEALQIYRNAIRRTRSPDFDAFGPYRPTKEIKYVHSIPMIGLEVGQELADVAPERDILEFVDWSLRRIMDHHVRPELRVLLEYLGPNSEVVDAPEGRCANPGHSIESMWFVMHQAIRRNDRALACRAAEIVRWMLEFGWDKDRGGIPHCLDYRNPGGPCWWPAADTKPWWSAGETLYALLLAHERTLEPWCMDWYWKVHDWSFAHYPDREHGEWHQRLDREGKVTTRLIALPVKDPFHLPRNILLALPILRRLSAGCGRGER